MDDYGPPELRLRGGYPMGTFESNIRQELMEEKKPERDVFGAVLDDTYRDFYDEFDEDDKEILETKPVMIPRYNGPLRTRCDRYEPVGGVYQIRGITNHRQHSNVYLSKLLSFFLVDGLDEHVASTLKSLEFAPFSIQQNWSKVRWRCPQTCNEYEYDVPAMVKLAPYLCSEMALKKQCRVKVAYDYGNDGWGATLPPAVYNMPDHAGGAPIATGLQGQVKLVTLRLYEPLLGFQSGWDRLGAIRPFNQQNSKYPLAIQDYDLQVTLKSERKEDEVYESLRDYRSNGTEDMTPDPELGIQGFRAVDHEYEIRRNTDSAAKSIYRLLSKIYNTETALVSFASEDNKQENKSVSQVMLHAPQMIVQRKTFVFKDDDHTILNRYTEPIGMSHYVRIGSDKALRYGFPEKMDFKFGSSKGLPSFFMFYLEENGSKKHQNPDDDFVEIYRNFFFNNEGDPGFDILKRQCPKIASMTLSSFNQEYPITKQLSLQDLEYLTCKNCHPECNFGKLSSRDPIIFLKMEDLGIGADSKGYPESRRVEFTINVTHVVIPESMKLFYSLSGVTPKYTLTCAMIYENQVLEGTNDRVEFLYKA